MQTVARQCVVASLMMALAAAQTGGQSPAIVSAVNQAATQGGQVDAMTANAAVAEVPAATKKFVVGFIQAYLARVTLQPAEKACIENNIGMVTQDGTALVTFAGQTIAELVAHEMPNPMAAMGAIPHVIHIITEVQKLAKGCFRHDFIAVLKQSFRHLENAKYIEGRLEANGIDIARVISQAIPNYENGEFGEVGGDFGTLVRKILLSQNTGAVEMVLPEGMEQSEVGSLILEGVMEGMFVNGTKVEIRNSVDPSVDINIDLHQCVADEVPYISTALNALYLAIAQITTNIEQWQLSKKGIETGVISNDAQTATAAPGNAMSDSSANGVVMNPMPVGGLSGMQLDWMDKLSGVMLNFPLLLQRCGFTPAQQQMMATALKLMNSTELTFEIPGPANQAQAGTAAALKFNEATEQWKVGNYKNFGFLLGGLMRDLLLTVFPQKYNVDEHGRLRDYLESKKVEHGNSPFALMVGGFSATMVAGLAMMRAVRPRSTGARDEDKLLEAEVQHVDCEVAE